MRSVHWVTSAILAGALAGCAVLPYPRDWAPTAATGDNCVGLSGDYENVGTTVEATNPMLPLSKQGPPDYLTRILLNRTLFTPGTHIHLDINAQGRILVSEVDEEGVVVSQREASSETHHCSGGKIRYSEGGGFAGGGLVGVVGSGWASISKAADGALIVEHSMWAAGIVVYAPVGVVGREWTRFSPWKESSQIATAPTEDPYAWPANSDGPARLVLTAAPLEYSALSKGPTPRNPSGLDCRAVLGEALEAALPAVRVALEQVHAVAIVEDQLRRELAGSEVEIGTAPGPDGAASGAKKFILADVRVRFGQINQAACPVKLVAAVEVRVQPVDRPPSPAPLYDVWASLDDVPVEAWARDPAAARDALTSLLQQLGRNFAASYRERTQRVRAD